MITMKGKYNTANVMIDQIDDTTREQIQGFLNHPAFGNTYIAIMPDCHKGAGAVIGMTMKMNDYIIPNVIGVDIGCGMLSFKLTPREVDLPALDKFIREEIPSGFKVNAKEIYLNGAFGIDFKESVEAVCKSIDLDSHRVLLSLGSLGSGNHFLECGHDSEKNIWVTIHSGSRNFGKCVAEFYQDKAKAGLKKYFLDGIYPELEFLPIDSQDAQDYIAAMKVAQQFASRNRFEMARRIIAFFGEDNSAVPHIESVHNFIDFDGRIIRKGATPANLGQKVLIPFNMKDGVAICVGKGSEKYNCSAPHGAGRILSRKKAKEQLNVEAFKLEMADAAVFTTSAGADTLDEAPGAYKDKDLILENIKETVDVIDFIKPFYNFKAGGD